MPLAPPAAPALALSLVFSLTLACLSLPAIAASPAVLPDTLAQRLTACTACHSDKERGDAFFPRIAGKPAGYLYNQLRNFREGRRRSPMMTYMVEHMPDAYLREIAEHFSQLHPAYPAPLASTLSPATLELGRQLVLHGDPARKIPACVACHGSALSGVAPAIPGLLGLPRDYLNAQFGAWRNKVRRAAAPDCMADITARLSLQDVAALSGWLAQQPVDPAARPASAPAAPLPLQCGSMPDAATERQTP